MPFLKLEPRNSRALSARERFAHDCDSLSKLTKRFQSRAGYITDAVAFANACVLFLLVSGFAPEPVGDPSLVNPILGAVIPLILAIIMFGSVRLLLREVIGKPLTEWYRTKMINEMVKKRGI